MKAPPRLPKPAPLPDAYRVYAHISGSFEAACPACGVLNLVGARIGRRRTVGRAVSGYDPLSGVLTCRGCRRPWYVGIVLWGVLQRQRGRPRDHVMNAEEIAQLRHELGGWAKAERAKEGRPSVNLVCWCGVDCPAHPVREDEDDD